jgi:hypothetical protein
MSILGVVDTPQSTEAIVKIATPSRKNRLRPNWSARYEECREYDAVPVENPRQLRIGNRREGTTDAREGYKQYKGVQKDSEQRQARERESQPGFSRNCFLPLWNKCRRGHNGSPL